VLLLLGTLVVELALWSFFDLVLPESVELLVEELALLVLVLELLVLVLVVVDLDVVGASSVAVVS